MEIKNNDIERYQIARKKVDEIKGFYGHLVSFVVVNLFLLFINLKYTPEYLWFFWSFISWGIGLFFHGMRVFNYFPFLSKDWEKRKIEQYIEEENKKNKFE